MKDRKRTHRQQKYQKYQKWTLFFFGQTNKRRRERFEPPKNNTHQRHEHIFSNKTHINNGRRIENEENKNEKAEPTK
jgi:hypothetical protein